MGAFELRFEPYLPLVSFFLKSGRFLADLGKFLFENWNVRGSFVDLAEAVEDLVFELRTLFAVVRDLVVESVEFLLARRRLALLFVLGDLLMSRLESRFFFVDLDLEALQAVLTFLQIG